MRTRKQETSREGDRKRAEFSLVRKIANFAQEKCRKFGKILLQESNSLGRRQVSEVRDFGAFTILTDTTQGMTVENSVKLWFHLGSPFDPDESLLVAHFEWQGEIAKYQLIVLHPTMSWRHRFYGVIRSSKKIIASLPLEDDIPEEEHTSILERLRVREVSRRVHRLGNT